VTGVIPPADRPSAPPPPPPAAPVSSTVAPAPAPARLCQKDAQDVLVEFSYQPEKIKVSHSTELHALKRAMGVQQSEEKPTTSVVGVVAADNPVTIDPGDTIISFNEIVLDGKDTLKYAQRLLGWTLPKVDGPAGSPMTVPVLMFTWGDFDLGPPYQPVYIVLTKVDVEYSRFTVQGVPTRAAVSLNCKVKVEPPGKQNPTSGGEPNRAGRRVTAGENIQGIARQRYGDPRRWRQIADLNGIDDPLRVRAGDVLYLPGPAELDRQVR
jgi:hypothetical protein